MAGIPLVFLGTARGAMKASTAGRQPADLRQSYTRLNPRILRQIPDSVLPAKIRDFIQTPEEACVVVNESILSAALGQLNANTPILEADVGAEFRTLTGELKKLSDVVKVIDQVAGSKGICNGAALGQSGKLSFAVSQEIADARKVVAWLDDQTHPEYKGQLGVFLRINRYFGSGLDNIVVWVPLGVTVTDAVRE